VLALEALERAVDGRTGAVDRAAQVRVGRALIEQLAADVQAVGKLESAPLAEGRLMTAVLAPLGAKS